jgi:hypothetical protein
MGNGSTKPSERCFYPNFSTLTRSRLVSAAWQSPKRILRVTEFEMPPGPQFAWAICWHSACLT